MSKIFKIKSGKIVASDPCYTAGEWCQGTIPAKNGDWEVYVETETNGRIKNISAWNIEAATNNTSLPNEVYTAGELPFVFGVDSGQFGYFDADSYRNDNAVGNIPLADWFEIEKDGDKFYSICCNATCSTDNYGVFPFGIVSSSGYGDGSYQTTGITDKDGNYIALATVFIEDRENDYDDEDEDEYEDETDEDI